MKPTNVSQLIGDLNAGIFEQQLGTALTNVATGTVEHNKLGEVVVVFKMKKIGDSNQINLAYSMEFRQPTKRGKKGLRDDIEYSQPMYVTANGILLFNSDPTAQLFNKEDTPLLAKE